MCACFCLRLVLSAISLYLSRIINSLSVSLLKQSVFVKKWIFEGRVCYYGSLFFSRVLSFCEYDDDDDDDWCRRRGFAFGFGFVSSVRSSRASSRFRAAFR